MRWSPYRRPRASEQGTTQNNHPLRKPEVRSSDLLSRSTSEISVRPQPGPQEEFAQSSADIVLYGGAAGGGKSWALLLEPLYHTSNSEFGAVIFRRTHPEITNEGGLWDESMKLYSSAGAVPKRGDLSWCFPSGASVSFGHMQRESDVLKWHSSQIALLEFDELTTFTEHQFVYMLSRNRSTCGIRPYVRAGCNPDASSWVARWVEWWIDQTTGYPIPERAGRVRWFVRDGETLRWSDSCSVLERDYPGLIPKSFTFIPATLESNRKLEERDPGYRANLLAQSRVDRERLLKGNWLIAAVEGRWPADYFGRHLYFTDWPLPEDRSMCVIAWDPNQGTGSAYGDYSAIVVLVRDNKGNLYADAIGSTKWPVEEAIEHALELCRVWNPDGFVIETNAFQKLIKTLFLAKAKEHGIPPPVYMINNSVKKEIRIERLGRYLEDRPIRIKGGSVGGRLLSEQLMAFPEGEHDDFPDALEMALRTMIRLWNKGRR